jgi:hypothetical protein
MARCRLGKSERALRRLAFESLTPEKVGKQTDGLVRMDAMSYGQSCLTGLELFRPGARRWGYTANTARSIHNRKG